MKHLTTLSINTTGDSNALKHLQLKPLADMYLPKIIKNHNCGFFDGGCWSFAKAIHRAFPVLTEIVAARSTDGLYQHCLVKIIGSDVVGDADGWRSFEDFRTWFRQKENIVIDAIEAVSVDNLVSINDDIELFPPLVEEIVEHIERNRGISFDLPLDSHLSVWINCGLYDGESGAITSDIERDCEGIPGAFVDGLESLILAHFCAGVDVTTSEYCEGIVTALNAMGANMDDCFCPGCVKEHGGLEVGNFKSTTGIPGDDQLDSFQNATFSSGPDNIAVSIAVTPQYPDECSSQNQIQEYLKHNLLTLSEAGWDVQVQIGPE